MTYPNGVKIVTPFSSVTYPTVRTAVENASTLGKILFFDEANKLVVAVTSTYFVYGEIL